MKIIEYRITYADGEQEILRVEAQSINTGLVKAVEQANRRARHAMAELHSVEFWMVLSTPAEAGVTAAARRMALEQEQAQVDHAQSADETYVGLGDFDGGH